MDIQFPTSRQPPLHAGVIRCRPEDFQVTEELGFEPDGEGEHLWIWIEKTANNTEWVARQLARAAGVRAADIGYAGLKDRNAVTRQWFSLPDTRRTASLELGELAEGVKILELTRNTRKLRRGALKGNRFRIQVCAAEVHRDPVEKVVEEIRMAGVPNYFGEQRFGRDGGNVEKARAMFAGSYRPKSRSERGILISAARSWLFNQILAERVQDKSWNLACEGGVFQLEGSHSVFVPDAIDDEIRDRVAALDIHPTGALWGRGALMSSGDVALREQSLADKQADLRDGLESAGLKQERRALRLAIPDIQFSITDEGLELQFSLASGAYATSVLREIVNYT